MLDRRCVVELKQEKFIMKKRKRKKRKKRAWEALLLLRKILRISIQFVQKEGNTNTFLVQETNKICFSSHDLGQSQTPLNSNSKY